MGGRQVTCRAEVTTAFEALNRETGRLDFSPAEILRRMRASGSTYRDSTIRTHVTAHMVEDGTLVRTGHGSYRLSRHRHRPSISPRQRPFANPSTGSPRMRSRPP